MEEYNFFHSLIPSVAWSGLLGTLIAVSGACFTDRTGVFSWCTISLFYFPWNMNFRKLFFVTRDLKVLCDLWKTSIIDRYSWFYHIILHDFEMQVLRMVRVVYWEWLRYVICNMEPWLSHSRFCLFQTLSLM